MIENRTYSIIVLLLVAIALLAYLYYHPQALTLLTNASIINIISLIIIRIFFQIISGLILRDFVSIFGTVLKFKEWFGLSIITTMGNYISPFSGGMIARAAYLKYRYAFSYAQFTSLLAASYLIFFWAVGFVGLISSLTSEITSILMWRVGLFFFIILLLSSLLILLPPIKISYRNPLIQFINKAIDGWTLIRNDKTLLFKLTLYSLTSIFLNGLSFWLAFISLTNIQFSFKTIFLISLLSIFSFLFNLTPSNLGIQEAIVSLASVIFGIGTSIGLMASLLIRATSLIPIFTLGPIFSLILTRELKAYKHN